MTIVSHVLYALGVDFDALRPFKVGCFIDTCEFFPAVFSGLGVCLLDESMV